MALLAWPGMMLLHECGHMLAAWLTGGTVAGLVWHPLVFSRTDVSPNPSPLMVVWAGPMVGVLIPLVMERLAAVMKLGVLYLVRLFCGFCLIANGAYIGLGWFDRAGDAGDMVRLGSPVWVLMLFGGVTCATGMWFWHLASFRLGFGKEPVPAIPKVHVRWVLVVGLLLNAIGFVVGNRGV